MERLIAIIGPTAIGKTRISIDLAQLLHTEVISGDSMLVYRTMDIGTAKPDVLERGGIIHHLLDILEPTEDFSVARFQQLAATHITAINNRNKIPILAGGTGLYIKALVEDYQFDPAPTNDKLRTDLEIVAEKHGNDYVHGMLAAVSPDTAQRLHPNDRRRVIRALEVYYLTGETISQSKTLDTGVLRYNAIVIGLHMDRKMLYERINRRVENMFAQGLVDEVRLLLANGVSSECQSMQGIGYKEIISYLKGEIDLSTAQEQIKQTTRHFAKRQLTWYRKMPYIKWVGIDDFDSYNKMLVYIYNCVAKKFCLK